MRVEGVDLTEGMRHVGAKTVGRTTVQVYVDDEGNRAALKADGDYVFTRNEIHPLRKKQDVTIPEYNSKHIVILLRNADFAAQSRRCRKSIERMFVHARHVAHRLDQRLQD